MSPRDRRTIKTRIDRMIDGFGRFQKRTGATTAGEHRARVALLDRLIEADQLEVIGMLSRDEITWTELRQAERKKRLHSDALAADVALSRPLWDKGDVAGAFSLTLPRMGRTGSSRDRYEVAFVQLREHAGDYLPAGSVVKDLKSVDWSAVRASMAALSPASRNRIRSAVSAFLTVFLGDKFHPFRRDVMRAIGAAEDETTAPRDVTLEEFWQLVNKMDDAVKPTAITLAGTGMRVGEYLKCDELSVRRLPRIWIPGGKTGGAETIIAEHLIPFVRQAIPCRLAPAPTRSDRGVQFDARYKRIWKAFSDASAATGIPFSPHYLRHLYAQLATAELPDVLVQRGLRHKTTSMTRRYSDRRMTSQVAEVVGSALLAKPKPVTKPRKKQAPASNNAHRSGVREKVREARPRKAS